jgi:predicted nucleic acid-binding protein
VKVISNSSPLINFAALERFDLRRTLYGTLTIPDGMYEEVVVAGQGRPHAITVGQAADRIIRESVHGETAVRALRYLGRGEAEAIALATETSGSLVIMDDRQGRLTAHALGLNVIGTLGILVIAERKGLLNALAPEIELLQKKVGFRLSELLKTVVLKEVGET